MKDENGVPSDISKFHLVWIVFAMFLKHVT